MSKLEKLKEKARGLEAKDAKAAIAAWLDVIKEQESESEPNPDLSIFNRIGDLAVKVKDSAGAADWYDRAVDKYAELGFHNNAIAMCNKVLRNAPGRQTTYLKLAKLYAAKGFMAEAKQNFVEYAERMQKLGKIQQAFSALKEFTDISPESAHLRQLLEEHLQMYGDPGRRPSAVAAPPAKPAPPEDLGKSGKRKTSSLVFLDVDEPPAHKAKPGVRPPTPAAPPPVAESLIEPVTADPDTSLEIESTSLVEGLETAGGSRLEGFETTSADFGEVQLGVGDVGSLREEVTADDVPPMMDLEPTVPSDAEPTDTDAELEPLLDDEIEIEAPAAPRPPLKQKEPAPARVPPVAPRRPGAPAVPGVGSPPRVAVPKTPKLQPPAPPGGGTPKVKPVVPRRPEGPPKRKTVVEVPPLELEPDFETAEAEAEAGAEDDASGSAARRSGYIDLGLDEAVNQGEETGSLAFANAEATPAKPTIDELEARVADDPDDPDAHQALGEALIAEAERERGIEELDLATTGFENLGNLPQARDLVDEILRLDPNSVRHRQKQVAFAFKS